MAGPSRAKESSTYDMSFGDRIHFVRSIGVIVQDDIGHPNIRRWDLDHIDTSVLIR